MSRRRIAQCRLLLLGALLAVSAYAVQAEPAPPWGDTQAQGEVVRGTFTQTKHLAELEQPLLSTGRFVVARDRGLIWHIEQPVSAELIMTRERMVQRSDGHEVARISAQEQPALGVVAAVLLAVFQADMDRLRQYFDIETQTREGGAWAMQLRPVASGVREFIEGVRIEGAANIERIEIRQAGGDRSIIELRTASPDPETAALSAEEQAKLSAKPSH